MADLEKVKDGLINCIEMLNPPGWRVGGCVDCPYKSEERCNKNLLADALELLKGQTIHPVHGITPRLYFCPDCEKQISDTFAYCPYCGKKVLWDGD